MLCSAGYPVQCTLITADIAKLVLDECIEIKVTRHGTDEAVFGYEFLEEFVTK